MGPLLFLVVVFYITIANVSEINIYSIIIRLDVFHHRLLPSGQGYDKEADGSCGVKEVYRLNMAYLYNLAYYGFQKQCKLVY